MNKKARIKQLGIVLLIVATVITTFVACNSEIEDSYSGSSVVSFVPSSSKSLNQTGQAIGTAGESINLYHWKYKVSETKAELDTLEYEDFSDQDSSSTGLGIISDLRKGKSYWFALAGFSTSNDELLWEGITDKAFKINERKTLVSINVSPKGKGILKYDIMAPVFNVWDLSTSTDGYVHNHPEKFSVSWVDLNDASTTGTDLLVTTLDSDGDYIYYNSLESDGIPMETGSYLFTIQQMGYTDDTYGYEPIKERTQVLIVQITSGINTVISGNLDSSALSVIDYDANEGIDVIFIQPSLEKIKSLDVEVTVDDETYEVLPNSRISIENGNFAKITFTTKTDSTDDLKLYVNKVKLDLTSKTDSGFINDLNGKTSGIKTQNENEVLAYKSEDIDYIVTVRYNQEAIAFTITDHV